MFGSKIAPTVLAGFVLFLGTVTITDHLAEGQETKPGTAPEPKGGKVVGILTHFEYNWTKANSPKADTRLSLKAEGEKESVNYLLALPNKAVDPKLEVALRKVFPSNTVSMEWEMRDGKKLVTKIAVLTPTSGQGVKRGIVMARDAGSVDLKGEDRGDLTVRYVVPWDAKAKAPNPGLVKALQGVNVGDRVAITWIANPERLWVTQVKIVSSAPVK
jgi:hypothetical protein